MPLEDEAGEMLDVAVRAVRRAAEIALGYYGRKVHTRMKPSAGYAGAGGLEPVTEADLAAHAAIAEDLAASPFPFPLVSEEAPDEPGMRASAERFWVLDPIDGTRAFLEGETSWAVQLGLVQAGRPVLGVVLAPAEATLWLAHVELGRAERVSLETGETEALRCSSRTETRECTLARSSTLPRSRVNRVAAELGIQQFVDMSGAGAKAVRIADARADLYLVTGSMTKIWDTCGPEAIVLAAGGAVTDCLGHLLRYDVESLVNSSGVVISNGHIHERVLEVTHRVLG